MSINFGLYPDFGPRWVTLRKNVVYNVMHSVGGLSGPGPLQAQDIRLLGNFWIHDQHAFGPVPPQDLIEVGNTTLPREDAKAACLALPPCAAIMQGAGLEPGYQHLLRT